MLEAVPCDSGIRAWSRPVASVKVDRDPWPPSTPSDMDDTVQPGPKLLDQLAAALRARRYSPRTEEAYRAWVRAYVRFHGMQHPAELDASHIEAFLTHLAAERRLSSSSQSQARAAVMFLYREVLKKVVEADGTQVVRAKNPKRLPTVLNRREVAAVLRQMSGTPRLVASLLYGAGLRLSEALEVRIKDLDLEGRALAVRSGKGGRQRMAIVPAALVQGLQDQVERRRALHDRDLAAGCGIAHTPGSYALKAPDAGTQFGWQFLFPAAKPAVDERTGARGRSHLHPTSIQRAVRAAARKLGIAKSVTCHTFRHSFATHLLEDGYDIRTIQELLGHRSVKTTMVYTHVLNRGTADILSPLDKILGE